MQKIKYLSILTVTLSILYCFSSLKTHAQDNYPRNIIERQNDKIGSILDQRNIESKISKQTTKNKKNIDDKILWQAAIDSLADRNIESSNYHAGSITTNWHRQNQLETKVIILIHDDKIAPESFSVKAYSRICLKNIRKLSRNEVAVDHELEKAISKAIIDKAIKIKQQKLSSNQKNQRTKG